MFAKRRTINREYIGKDIKTYMDVPDLIDIQTSSYEYFLQKERLDKNEPLLNQGLQEVFNSTFPIESPDGSMELEYEYYFFETDKIRFSEAECKQKGLTYCVPLKAKINLVNKQNGAILSRDIYMGDIPLMTERGTFIVNGTERVVISQVHRSPGVIFYFEKKTSSFRSRIIPYRGVWLEFEIDHKKELIYAILNRKNKKLLGTTFLRALGFETREEIISFFYESETL